MCILGKIVKSNSHTDYVCQIIGPSEAEYVPQNTDYAFGTFVKIDLNDHGDRCLVGLIYDTVLLNPDFGRLGPRLSTESDLQIFSPDYLNERAVLVGILVIGQIVDGQVQQGVPLLAATNEATVNQLDGKTIKQFHTNENGFQLTYICLILWSKPGYWLVIWHSGYCSNLGNSCLKIRLYYEQLQMI
jgi:hypothetical protein